MVEQKALKKVNDKTKRYLGNIADDYVFLENKSKSCFCALKKMFRAQKTKFYTSFFKGAKNREIQKTEKMDLRHLLFWGCLKSAIFGGKPMPTRPP